MMQVAETRALRTKREDYRQHPETTSPFAPWLLEN